ncbi:AAEL017195-PA [Aedes aegypti]|uniref:AAEL017195-PA n=1 Tax=Aedes aegypti TaxID=7159 RepID=J9HY20_AEDAE|nr:AAEL017195-PA [Aedes aegypti]
MNEPSMESSTPHKQTIIRNTQQQEQHINIQSPSINAQSRCGGLSTSRGLIAILGGQSRTGSGPNCLPIVVVPTHLTPLEVPVSLHATVGQRLLTGRSPCK